MKDRIYDKCLIGQRQDGVDRQNIFHECSPSPIPARLNQLSDIRLLTHQTTMAKSKAAKRKRNAQLDLPQKQAKPSNTLTPPPDGTNLEPKHLNTVVSDEELDITVETLAALAQYPNLTKSKACKDLRVAVYDFRQACTTGVNNAGTTGSTAYCPYWYMRLTIP